jgi:hypothetical protein
MPKHAKTEGRVYVSPRRIKVTKEMEWAGQVGLAKDGHEIAHANVVRGAVSKMTVDRLDAQVRMVGDCFWARLG